MVKKAWTACGYKEESELPCENDGTVVVYTDKHNTQNIVQSCLGGERGGELVPETLFFEEKGNFFEEYEPDEFPADDVCSDACESDDDIIAIGEGEEGSNTES